MKYPEIGDRVIIENLAYLRDNNLQDPTLGTVTELNGHKSFYTKDHVSILLTDGRIFVVPFDYCNIVEKFGIKSEEESVNHPSHYGGDTLYETIKVMKNRLTREEFIGAMKFNVYKYNDRAKLKGSEVENYEKAQFYQNYLVDFIKEK
jgi:hypothetical protein